MSSSRTHMRYSTGGMVAAAMILEVLSTLLITLRFASRRLQLQKLQADDWLMVPAMLFATGVTAIDIYVFLTLPNIPTIQKTVTADSVLELKTVERVEFSMYVLTTIALLFIKVAIACLYRRLFKSKRFAYVVSIYIGVMVIWAIIVTFGIIFGCGTHFEKIFPGPQGVSCSSYYRMGIVAFSTDVALDVVLVVLPLPMVYTLQMSWRKRFAAGSIFLVGFLAVGASVGRLVAWIVDTGANDVSIENTTFASIWNLVSIHIGIIVACLPTLGPLLKSVKSSRTVMRIRSSKTMAKVRMTMRSKLPWLKLHTTGGKQASHFSAGMKKQRSNPLLSSAHASDPEIGAVPDDQEMLPHDVYIRRDMVVEEEQIPQQPVNADSWLQV